MKKKRRMTLARLAEIERRSSEATPGPWFVGDEAGGDVSEVISKCPCCGLIAKCAQFGAGHSRSNYNSEFIAHAREDVVDLLAEVQRLRRQLSKPAR